jgi:hypothetical protein
MAKKQGKKGLKLPGLGAKKPRKAPRNSARLSQSDQDKLREITKAEKAAKRKYGGRRPQRIRDPEYTKTAKIANGDVIVRLDTSAVPEVRIYVTEREQPRKGGRREVKKAGKDGFWRWRN